MTTAPVPSITNELIADLELAAGHIRCDLPGVVIAALLAERAELQRDKARIDWLADPLNTIGNIQLPTECVHENMHSLRDAIDAAMQL